MYEIVISINRKIRDNLLWPERLDTICKTTKWEYRTKVMCTVETAREEKRITFVQANHRVIWSQIKM